MIRPIEQHERIHPRDLPERVRQTEGVPDSHSRDFSYSVKQAEDKEKRRQQNETPEEEDRYEASEQSEKNPSDTSDQPPPRNPANPSPDNGGIDITI